MKLIDKAAVVAEIERRKRKLLDHVIFESDKEWVVRTAHQFNRIIMFIDTLEVKEVDEEPVSNDLEEAADKHLIEKGYLLTTKNGEHLAEVEAKGLFKAGAQWQKEQMITKACNYLFSHMGLFVTFINDDIVEDIESCEFIKKFRIAMEDNYETSGHK